MRCSWWSAVRVFEAWEPISEVEGAGNSQTMITYGTTDQQQPLHGTSYYRLKQIEHDWTEELSQVRQVQLVEEGQDLVAWPNPATDRLQVQVDTPYSSAEVFNVLGQPVAVARELVGNVDRVRRCCTYVW